MFLGKDGSCKSKCTLFLKTYYYLELLGILDHRSTDHTYVHYLCIFLMYSHMFLRESNIEIFPGLVQLLKYNGQIIFPELCHYFF